MDLDDLATIHDDVVRHLQENNTRAADKLLAPLGFRYRLSPQVWSKYGEASSKSTMGGSDDDEMSDVRVQCYDHVLPPNLLSAAQQTFGKDASFWKDHHYPTPSFFSYYYELEKKIKTMTVTSRKRARGGDRKSTR